MSAELRLYLILEFYIWKKNIENKAKQRWYYSRIPKHLVMAFTLAEVLITLLVIGIVASIVIPVLINDIQDQQYKVAWKKTYGVMSQATTRLMSDNAGTIAGLCSSHDCIKNLYLPYLSYAKSCNYGTAAGICWHDSNTIKWLSGDFVGSSWNFSTLVLNDGSLISFYSESSCPSTAWNNRCGYIVTDINGFKGPNTIGKDIFFIHLLENKIEPIGTQGYGGENDCDDDNSPSGNGYGCAAKYLR